MDPSKQALAAKLAALRAEMSGHTLGIRRGLSVIEKIKHGVRHTPAVWFGAAALLGLWLSKGPRSSRKKKESRIYIGPPPSAAKQGGKAALALALLKLGLDAARPTILKWVRERAFPTRRPSSADVSYRL